MSTLPLPRETTPVNGYYVVVFSDVVLTAPHPEDGECRERIVYYVVLENERGERWGSHRGFDSEEDAARCIPKVRARLAKGESPVGSSHWYMKDPAYGSQAYVDVEPELVARERADDESGLY